MSNTQKYKIIKGSRLFDQLCAIYVQMQEAERLARELAIKYGAIGYASECDMLAGGIRAFYFAEEPGLSFKKLLTNTGDWYTLNINDSQAGRIAQTIYNDIAALPTIDWQEFHALVAYEEIPIVLNDGEIAFLHPPLDVRWAKEYILVAVWHEVSYAAVPGMEKITNSEYKRLEAAIK